ncbi:DUF1351 domain-containing protein [Paucilactobacillus suebicus]|uniref:Uncharacterized protein n=1 Tax=Paucilactobacillus suebicus DSM 5007 = KCTC 3549 TaxID=1423807 RepID=A0A0R1VXN2_9LACO|nr:DUF1351 domain-containing protein [Paucilactobacillus suebicus]KRM10189.1 hypothetical protein FD16_GL001459 [Paucilactobacillus suebicus DSM 5007 = KCTC 3549]
MTLKPVIFDGYAETKENLGYQLKQFEGYQVENVKNGKHTVAKLRKLRTEVNERKKEYKRPYTDAIKPMEDQAKELMAMIDDAINPIAEQLKNIENSQRDEREKRVKSLIADMAFSHHIDPLEVDIKPKWLTKSIGDLELKREIADELKLMVKFSKGTLPDGINRVNGALVSDDGEMVQKHLLTIYVTNEQLKTLLSDLNVAEVPYEKLEV